MSFRRDAEPPPLLGVQDRPEDTGRFEMGETEPVYRAVARHERAGVEVADHPVVLKPAVTRGHLSQAPFGIPLHQPVKTAEG